MTGAALVANRRPSVLHLIVKGGATSAPFNEHVLPGARDGDVAACSFYPIPSELAAGLAVFAGDGTAGGFLRAVRSAWATRSFDVVHAHSHHVALLFQTLRMRYRRLRMVRFVLTVHSSMGAFDRRNRMLVVPALLAADRVVFCSRSSADSFRRISWLIGSGRAVVIRNGVDLDRIGAVRRLPPRDGEHLRVTSVGRLIPVKNPTSAISGAHRSGVVDRLSMIGDGVLRCSAEDLTRRLRWDEHVRFTGVIGRERVFDVLGATDVFLSTSRGEGLPIAVLEAMACGCALVLSDIPAHRELVEGGAQAELVACDDVDGIARALRRMRELGWSGREERGHANRVAAERTFSLTAMRRSYLELYAGVCAAGPD